MLYNLVFLSAAFTFLHAHTMRSIHDPRDPWAFRTTWTGEMRNSYDDLWIWITLIVGIVAVAFCFLIPILMHRYCRDACFCGNWCRWFDRLLLVCHAMDNDRQQKARERKMERRQRNMEQARPTEITHDIKVQLRESQKRKRKEWIENFHRLQAPPTISQQPRPTSYPANFYPRPHSSYHHRHPPESTRIYHNHYHKSHQRHHSLPRSYRRLSEQKQFNVPVLKISKL